MIHTAQSIETQVSQVRGTWVKRRNLRERLKSESNALIAGEIDAIRKDIRMLKSNGATQQELSPFFAKVSNLEARIL